MTANRLHKLLSKLIAEGHGRSKICIDKETFWHALESDGAVILDVVSVRPQWVPLTDDDGGAAYNKDGTERGSDCIVLSGSDPLGVRTAALALAGGEKS